MDRRSPGHLRLAAFTLPLIALLAAACFPEHPQSTFDAQGPVAQKQLDLFMIIFWAAVFVFVVVQGALLYTVLRFRRRQQQDSLPPQWHGNPRLEVAWTIAPAIVLAVIAVPTITTIWDTATVPPGESLEVNVTAHQWWWEFQYPGLGVVTANELHVPVGRTVKVSLESRDVIHSFWVPKLTGKTDLIPRNTNVIWFRADQAGTYYGQCAEFCGIAHAQMRFRVIADAPEAFDAWVALQGERPPAPAGPAAQGFRVFVQKGCTVCHTFGGSEGEGVQQGRMDGFLKGQAQYPAPNLSHFASRETFAAGLLTRTDENLRRWLLDPRAVKPGNRMAQLAEAYTNAEKALSEDDISALVTYLQSLK
ncbi:MAG: cytochrome c oxidase subunit II [Chloroflexi bacterium]|nr:cytochrome c oxidase subunit II [Chloroflexota bacterium]